MCNPGSAIALNAPRPETIWGPIAPDPTLRAVARLLVEASAIKQPGQEHYIAILNCFYTCDQHVRDAFDKWRESGCTHWEVIPEEARFVLLAWGSDKPSGLIAKSIKAVLDSKLPVFCCDPTVSSDAGISTDIRTVWFPAHPLNPVFHLRRAAMAREIGKVFLIGTELEPGFRIWSFLRT